MWEIYIWFTGLPAPWVGAGPRAGCGWPGAARSPRRPGEGRPTLSVLKTMSRKNGSDRQAEGRWCWWQAQILKGV